MRDKKSSSIVKAVEVIIIIAIIAILVAHMILLFYMICDYSNSSDIEESRIAEIENKISDLQKNTKATKSADESEYIKAIEFLQNESTVHREFIEQQRQYLIWSLGIVVTGVGLLITFFEISKRKDIDNLINQRYSSLIDEKISSVIGDEEKIKYLKKCIDKEQKAKKSRILFLSTETLDKGMSDIIKFLKNGHYVDYVDSEIIDRDSSYEDLKEKVNGFNIIVYKIHICEELKEKKNDPTYEEREPSFNYVNLSQICKEQEKFCVIYAGAYRINTNHLNSYHLSTTNMPSTLLERLHTCLYLSPENNQ